MDVRMQKDVRICSYSDADYDNDPVDQRSISGYVTMIDNNVLSYASLKQELNALSTCEAKCVEMSEATKDLLWLAGQCKELHRTHPTSLLYGDNQGAIELILKPDKRSKSKHIDNKHHMHVGTDVMVANVITKALGPVKFATFTRP
ncbi:RxLR effector protein [Phytophthora megakarya]|uniref:RxLR effector protein n=1 Tax=Phytophthora megakarya TaxID=4795 RepID=A0A225WKB8_9STRA|nr:RxLR effector protein [Phytophthora megakarya]